VNILKDLNKGYVCCPHCGKVIKNEGKLLNGKYYHDMCADKVALKTAYHEDEKPKKVYIAV
jgi:hypothetical protein